MNDQSLTCILMKEIDKKISFSNDKFLKFEKFISDEPTRWIILFISVMIIYIYMLYISYTFKRKKYPHIWHKYTILKLKNENKQLTLIYLNEIKKGNMYILDMKMNSFNNNFIFEWRLLKMKKKPKNW
jgi:hypothetical protein